MTRVLGGSYRERPCQAKRQTRARSEMHSLVNSLRLITCPTEAHTPPPRLSCRAVVVCECEGRKFFIDNLLVRIHFTIEMIRLDRPRAKGV